MSREYEYTHRVHCKQFDSPLYLSLTKCVTDKYLYTKRVHELKKIQHILVF